MKLRGTKATLAALLSGVLILSACTSDADVDDTAATTEPTEVIICEGVGVGARANRELLDVLIWLRVPDQVRHDRAMSRDGDSYRGKWDSWAAQERRMLDQDQIYDAADLVLVADEPDERHHTSALAVVKALLSSNRSVTGPSETD